MTNKELTIRGLIAYGCSEVIPSPSRKYRAFRHPVQTAILFFVGRSGGLRYGEKVTGSFSLTDTRRHKALIEIGDPAIKWESAEQARAAWVKIVNGGA